MNALLWITNGQQLLFSIKTIFLDILNVIKAESRGYGMQSTEFDNLKWQQDELKKIIKHNQLDFT